MNEEEEKKGFKEYTGFVLAVGHPRKDEPEYYGYKVVSGGQDLWFNVMSPSNTPENKQIIRGSMIKMIYEETTKGNFFNKVELMPEATIPDRDVEIPGETRPLPERPEKAKLSNKPIITHQEPLTPEVAAKFMGGQVINNAKQTRIHREVCLKIAGEHISNNITAGIISSILKKPIEKITEKEVTDVMATQIVKLAKAIEAETNKDGWIV